MAVPGESREDRFRRKAIEFYESQGRKFPWRLSRDPYVVLVSEILLQKTTSKQVLEIFNQFFERYPTVIDLARASPRELEALIGRLGLRKRAGYLVQLAKSIVEKFGGSIPRDAHALMSLKGVGRYTANAVLSFAYGECVPVVDTNVARVLRRFFCIESKKPAYADKDLWRLAERVMPKEKCREFNYGLLDIGNLYCKPTPECNSCPLSADCCFATLKRRF